MSEHCLILPATHTLAPRSAPRLAPQPALQRRGAARAPQPPAPAQQTCGGESEEVCGRVARTGGASAGSARQRHQPSRRASPVGGRLVPHHGSQALQAGGHLLDQQVQARGKGHQHRQRLDLQGPGGRRQGGEVVSGWQVHKPACLSLSSGLPSLPSHATTIQVPTASPTPPPPTSCESIKITQPATTFSMWRHSRWARNPGSNGKLCIVLNGYHSAGQASHGGWVWVKHSDPGHASSQHAVSAHECCCTDGQH